MLRIFRLLRNPRAAIDLASIMVGVIIIGIISGIIGATVFAVIPWVQDEAAKQNLSAVKDSEGVAKVKLGGYKNWTDLQVNELIPAGAGSGRVTADISADGSCYLGLSQSAAATHNTYWVSSKQASVRLYTENSDQDPGWCGPVTPITELISDAGAGGGNGNGPAGTRPQTGATMDEFHNHAGAQSWGRFVTFTKLSPYSLDDMPGMATMPTEWPVDLLDMHAWIGDDEVPTSGPWRLANANDSNYLAFEVWYGSIADNTNADWRNFFNYGALTFRLTPDGPINKVVLNLTGEEQFPAGNDGTYEGGDSTVIPNVSMTCGPWTMDFPKYGTEWYTTPPAGGYDSKQVRFNYDGNNVLYGAKLTYYDVDGYKHRTDGPAEIDFRFIDGGSRTMPMCTATWYDHGNVYRGNDDPAILQYIHINHTVDPAISAQWDDSKVADVGDQTLYDGTRAGLGLPMYLSYSQTDKWFSTAGFWLAEFGQSYISGITCDHGVLQSWLVGDGIGYNDEWHPADPGHPTAPSCGTYPLSMYPELADAADGIIHF